MDVIKKVDSKKFNNSNSNMVKQALDFSVNEILDDFEIYEPVSKSSDMSQNQFTWNDDMSACTIKFYDGSTGECSVFYSHGKPIYYTLEITKPDGSLVKIFSSITDNISSDNDFRVKTTSIEAYDKNGNKLSVEILDSVDGKAYTINPEVADILNLDLPKEMVIGGIKREVVSYTIHQNGSYTVQYDVGGVVMSELLGVYDNAERLFDAVVSYDAGYSGLMYGEILRTQQ